MGQAYMTDRQKPMANVSGDWEMDLIIGKGQEECHTDLVRAFKNYLLMAKLPQERTRKRLQILLLDYSCLTRKTY